MVFFYESKVDKRYKIFMGRDKFENEKLIEFGFPEDVWFHVDAYSSAHVYLRMPVPDKPLTPEILDECLKEIPQGVMDEMCQLTKENSIEGKKQPKVDIIYTLWHNLKKDIDMATGTIGFKNEKSKCVIKIKDVATNKDIIKPLEKTKSADQNRDYRFEKEERLDLEKQRKRKEISQRKEKEKQEKKDREEQAKLKSYDSIFSDPTKLTKMVETDGTQEMCKQLEDDFM
jgi:hypothetical protein